MNAQSRHENTGLSLMGFYPSTWPIEENDAIAFSSGFSRLIEDAVEKGTSDLYLVHQIDGETVQQKTLSETESVNAMLGLYIKYVLASGVDLADAPIMPSDFLFEEKLTSGVKVKVRCIIQITPDVVYVLCRILKLPN